MHQYHPKYKDLSLEKRIVEYYSQENLNKKRDVYYQEALKTRTEGKPRMDNYEEILYWGSILSPAGLFLLGSTHYDPKKDRYLDKGKIKKTQKPKEPLTVNAKGKDNKSKVNTQAIRANQGIKLKLLLPVIKPTVNKIIKPVVNIIVKPIMNKIVKPLYQKVVKPVLQTIKKKVNQPIYRNVVKPISQFINKKIIQPVKKITKALFKRK